MMFSQGRIIVCSRSHRQNRESKIPLLIGGVETLENLVNFGARSHEF